MLRAWIVLLSVLGRYSYKYDNSNYGFYFILISILCLLVFSFSSYNVLMFYLTFEGVFILIYILVIGWGYTAERLQASIYIIFYTLIFSMPFLIILFLYYPSKISLNFRCIFMGNYLHNLPLIWVAGIFLFLVKLPIYTVHLWLPKAHVEAPVAGSIILAGILLKLGGYGIIRCAPLTLFNIRLNPYFFLSLSAIRIIFICLVCVLQVDIKSLVAYSSISHMGLIVMGLLSQWEEGFKGAMYIIVGHGLCSSCLFYILFLIYGRLFSRRVIILKGGLLIFKTIVLWFFVFRALNIGVPPSLNFFREVSILIASVGFRFIFLFALIPIFLISGIYCIYFFISINHGAQNLQPPVRDILTRENLIVISHITPSFLLTYRILIIG